MQNDLYRQSLVLSHEVQVSYDLFTSRLEGDMQILKGQMF